MSKLQFLIDLLTLEDLRKYQAQTDKLIWIETELLDPAGISRRHAEKVETKMLELLQDVNSQVKTN